VTNGVVLTTTFHGDLYALDAATGAILFKTPMSAGATRQSPSTATTSSPGPAPRCPLRSET
jgi:outer membrane protein assembly factor BamB